ncbi:MAG: aminopeptidase P family protein, partial [Clostridiales bacterium]|nr:aminopeptidase P family protein [Clostridiales bacterium]
FLAETINKLGLQNIGFEENDVSYGRFIGWKTKMPTIKFNPLHTETTRIRMIKDFAEIEKLQSVVTLGDAAFSNVLKFIKPGVRENEVAAEIEYYMRKNGASSTSFETIIASGKRSSMPHAHATNKIIEAGDPVTMDFGAIVDGYCSDMTRTVFVGKPEQKMKDIYNTVLEAQEASEAGAFAGKTGQEVDDISRKIIYGAGYEGCYGHGLGHSVGIEVHEEPRFSTKETRVMENGMIMTVEPGIYVENYGGVRIENMIVINDDSPIILTNSTKELIIL